MENLICYCCGNPMPKDERLPRYIKGKRVYICWDCKAERIQDQEFRYDEKKLDKKL